MRIWERVSNWGSLRAGDTDDVASAFHAGHLNDALRVSLPPFNPLLVASDTSGVWIANEAGGLGFPLGWSWEDTHFNRLCNGVRNPLHVFAAGSALYETDVTSSTPLLHWRKIAILKDLRRRDWSVGEIYRAIVVQALNKLVIATDAGVFWAEIPSAGGSYVFKQAKGLPGGLYAGLAEGESNKVVAGAWGSDGASHCGIFIGAWSPPNGDLVFKPSTIKGDIDVTKMLRTEVAACAGNRSVLFAVCGGGGSLSAQTDKNGNVVKDRFGNIVWDGVEVIYRVLRSTDGGAAWTVCGAAITGSSDLLFGGPKDVLGQTQQGYNLCIGVSPLDPRVVAVGVGGVALSRDAGNSWSLPPATPHLHTDIHGLVFDQSVPSQ